MRRPNRPFATTRDRGAIIPVTALMLGTLMLMTSFAVDYGRLRSERRSVQADADAIALDAVQKMAGNPQATALSVALAEANQSALRNGLPATLTSAEVSVGFWNVETQELCATPVVSVAGPDNDICDPSPPAVFYPDAVQVDLDSTLDLFFQPGDRTVDRTGVAVARAQTRGELGSVFSGIQFYDPTDPCSVRFAANTQMTFMNQIYTEYLGINVAGGVGAAADTGPVNCDPTGPSDGLQLDALSYQGLAFGKVSLGQLATAMGFASPDELVAANVTAQQVLTGAATAMQSSGDVADAQAGAVLASFAGEVDASRTFDFEDIVSSGVGGGANCGTDSDPNSCAADATINALQLVNLTALAIDGNNFVGTGIEIPLDIPFLATPTVSPRISVIEKPQFDADWRYAGQTGPRTAQVKIAVDIPLADIDIGLSSLGIPGLVDVQLDGNIPLVIEVARADSLYEAVQCSPQGVEGSIVDMLVDTGAVSIGFGGVTDADLQSGADVPLTAESMITGSVNLGLPGIPPLIPPVGVTLDLAAITRVSERQTFQLGSQFSGGYDTNVNLLGASETHRFTSAYPTSFYRYDGGLSGTSVTDSTFGSITYNAVASNTLSKLANFGVTQAAINNLVSSALQPVIDELGSELVDGLLTALGITVAGADGRILDVRCQVPAIANRG